MKMEMVCYFRFPYKVEAQIVSEVLGTILFLKDKAKKSVLLDSDCQLMHIATHGSYFDIKEEDEGNVVALSRSCFYLAGANDWMFNQSEYSDCGTGIMTAGFNRT